MLAGPAPLVVVREVFDKFIKASMGPARARSLFRFMTFSPLFEGAALWCAPQLWAVLWPLRLGTVKHSRLPGYVNRRAEAGIFSSGPDGIQFPSTGNSGECRRAFPSNPAVGIFIKKYSPKGGYFSLVAPTGFEPVY